ncbi:MAG: hypothetical protein Kow0010_23150 [Dehalococcoidia bacterium]
MTFSTGWKKLGATSMPWSVASRRTDSTLSYLPDEPGEETGAPIVGWIAGNTCAHYEEHLAWISDLVASMDA